MIPDIKKIARNINKHFKTSQLAYVDPSSVLNTLYALEQLGYEVETPEPPKGKNGCGYREWGWHDGGPDYKCSRPGKNKGKNCKDSYSDYFDGDCEILEQTRKAL